MEKMRGCELLAEYAILFPRAFAQFAPAAMTIMAGLCDFLPEERIRMHALAGLSAFLASYKTYLVEQPGATYDSIGAGLAPLWDQARTAVLKAVGVTTEAQPSNRSPPTLDIIHQAIESLEACIGVLVTPLPATESKALCQLVKKLFEGSLARQHERGAALSAEDLTEEDFIEMREDNDTDEQIVELLMIMSSSLMNNSVAVYGAAFHETLYPMFARFLQQG